MLYCRPAAYLCLCACVIQLNHYYEARRDDVWYGYKYPLQPSELREGDVALTPDMPEHHAYEWNKRHPGHEFGVEHGKKKHH